MADTSKSLNSSTITEDLPVPDEDNQDSRHRIMHQIFDECIAPEEKAGNLDNCRKAFNILLSTMPPLSVWLSYIYFELRHGDVDQAREIFEALVKHRPDPSSWVHYAEFEFNYGSRVGVRICGQRAILNLNNQEGLEALLLAFAKFEEQCNELENATRLYKSVLDNRKEYSKDLYKKILGFKQRHSQKNRIVKRVLLDRRDYFESLVKINPSNYDAWWDYIRMLEDTAGDENCVRLLYNRALENVPKIEEKSYWKQYVYLWILYALFEEIDTGDTDRARQAYIDCIRLIPHGKFSFSKIWLFAAMFEIKQLQVENMRKILDSAIRIVPKKKIVRKYLEIEVHLGNVQQCRKLYTKLVQWSRDDSHEEWIKSAQFENSINETERARFIFQLAVLQPALQNSKLLWKAYTDFEISVGEIEFTRELHNKILRKKYHLNVCISLAKFEAYGVQEILKKRCRLREDEDDDTTVESRCLEEARKVFNNGLKCNGCFEEDYRIPTSSDAESEKNQIVIVKEWVEVERSFGELGDCGKVYDKLPWRLKLRIIQDDDDEVMVEEEEDSMYTWRIPLLARRSGAYYESRNRFRTQYYS